LLAGLMCTVTLAAQDFDRYFVDITLRVDYIFSGDATHQEVSFNGLAAQPVWAGRRHQLSELPLQGNGILTMRDVHNGTVIYRTSFSSLFHEWLQTDEARHVRRAFESTFLLPFPIHDTEVEVTLLDYRHQPITTMKHVVRPDDILIRQQVLSEFTPHHYLQRKGEPQSCIDIAILAEGYRADEEDLFYEDAKRVMSGIFSYSPFREMRDRFNVIAVAAASEESGTSIPKEGNWVETAFGSHYSTFYSDRYLTPTYVKRMHDALASFNYEHVIILVNSKEYGGGGIYNAYTIATAHHPLTIPVVVHEFGHAFGGLGDEYFYEGDTMEDTYPTDVEPWEPNLTTLVAFDTKWKDMLKAGTPVPTPVSRKETYPVGVFEGGGYSFKGVYRPADECRMRNNTYPTFCPVCERALKRMIDFYVK
jgi:hypothetical protein